VRTPPLRAVAYSALFLAFLGWSALDVAFLVHVWLTGSGGDKAFASVLFLPLWLLGATLLSLLAADLGGQPARGL
jgi:hypothetical protein